MKLAVLLSILLLPGLDAVYLPIRLKQEHNQEPPQLPAKSVGFPPSEGKRDAVKTNEVIADRIIRINTANHLDLFEGDIVLDERDKRGVDLSEIGDKDGSLGRMPEKRNAQRSREYLWKNRVVPYAFDPNLPVEFRNTIQAAIGEYHLHTCLRFKPRTSEPHWVLFVHKSGCWSSVGQKFWRTNEGQELSLGPGCNSKGTIMHELMHAIGFWHEQSRPDRNQYVEVLWENIIDDEAHNFNKYGHDMIDRMQVPYDYNSIMHYGKSGFSKNGKDTLRPVIDPNQPIGQRTGFSPMDIREINTLYDCANNIYGWSAWSDYSPCSLKCKKYRQRFCASDSPAVDCPGSSGYGVQTEEGVCDQLECYAPVTGHWARWSSWGACSTSCGHGAHSRTRTCDDPPPTNGGSNCVGDAVESLACILRRCGLGPDDCEFDYDGFCFWTKDSTNFADYDWLRMTGKTPSPDTGPNGDHTTGSGHYLYLESSSPAQPDYKARLLSKSFPATTGRCVSFWYHMYGSAVEQLSVFLVEQGGTRHTLWTKRGAQGDTWIQARVSLTSTAEYQLVFEGVRGRSFTGDIAIDDITFQEHHCFDAVGCFKDNCTSRALPVLLDNLRSDIDWYHMDKTINKCAELAYNKGYKIFAVQFYGECYSGTDYDKYGKATSDKCWAGVGRTATNFVYKLNK